MPEHKFWSNKNIQRSDRKHCRLNNHKQLRNTLKVNKKRLKFPQENLITLVEHTKHIEKHHTTLVPTPECFSRPSCHVLAFLCFWWVYRTYKRQTIVMFMYWTLVLSCWVLPLCLIGNISFITNSHGHYSILHKLSFKINYYKRSVRMYKLAFGMVFKAFRKILID